MQRPVPFVLFILHTEGGKRLISAGRPDIWPSQRVKFSDWDLPRRLSADDIRTRLEGPEDDETILADLERQMEAFAAEQKASTG